LSNVNKAVIFNKAYLLFQKILCYWGTWWGKLLSLSATSVLILKTLRRTRFIRTFNPDLCVYFDTFGHAMPTSA
jgi:hypothetical protein